MVLTTQVQNEGSDLGIYQVGHSLKADLGVMETYDMTLEMAVAKLMWALAVMTVGGGDEIRHPQVWNDIS